MITPALICSKELMNSILRNTAPLTDICYANLYGIIKSNSLEL
jgi:hypothetical protein